MLKKLKKAFTITELVIVIAVIAILAAVLIPTFANVIESANQSAALQSCRNALSDYQGVIANNGETTSDMENMVFESDGYVFVYKNGALQYIGEVSDLQSVRVTNETKDTSSGEVTTPGTTLALSENPNINGITISGDSGATMTVSAGAYSLTFLPGVDDNDAERTYALGTASTTSIYGESVTKQIERLYVYTVEINGTAYVGWFTLEMTASTGADNNAVAAFSIQNTGANYSRVAYCTNYVATSPTATDNISITINT